MPPPRTTPLTDYQPRRILLVKPSALGDIAHALPVLSSLRRRFPHAHLTWLVNRAYEPLLRGHPDLDETLPFDRAAGRRGLWTATTATAAFLRRLRAGGYDLAIDLQGLFRSGLFAAATRAPRRVGLASCREGASWFYTDVVPDTAGAHAVDRYWRVVEALGGTGPREFRLPVDPVAAAWADDQLRGCPRPWLLLGVGARWVTKRWPPEHFAALAARARAAFGGTAVFVGGGDETPAARAAALRLGPPLLDLTGRTTLPQLAAVLARADVMLANDTGPLHLAVALGRPVVAPYTCTQVVRTGPYGQPAAGVETRVACAGSLRRTCSHMTCMAELTPDRLWPTLQGTLQQWARTSQSA